MNEADPFRWQGPRTVSATISPTPARLREGTSFDDTMTGGGGADWLVAGFGDDRLSGGGRADTLAGGEGRDTLSGGAGSDLLDGGDGSDLLNGGAGNDLVVTGAGADRVVFGPGGGQDRVTDFTPGEDRLVLSGVAAEQMTARLLTLGSLSGLELRLATGESLFLESVGAVSAAQLGLAGSFAPGSVAPGTPFPPAPPPAGLPPTTTTVTGTAADDWLSGTAGADLMLGGAGADELQGLGGNDVIRGGLGWDALRGGAGADTFVFARGDAGDWIRDFAPGADRLRLEGIAASEVVQAAETRWGIAGIKLAFGAGDEVFLEGVLAPLAGPDLVFA